MLRMHNCSVIRSSTDEINKNGERRPLLNGSHDSKDCDSQAELWDLLLPRFVGVTALPSISGCDRKRTKLP